MGKEAGVSVGLFAFKKAAKIYSIPFCRIRPDYGYSPAL